MIVFQGLKPEKDARMNLLITVSFCPVMKSKMELLGTCSATVYLRY